MSLLNNPQNQDKSFWICLIQSITKGFLDFDSKARYIVNIELNPRWLLPKLYFALRIMEEPTNIQMLNWAEN